MTTTRLFFATDVHGSESCFLKFLNVPKIYKAKVLVLGGDLTGKMMVPLVERSDGKYEATFLGIQHVISREEIGGLEQKIQRVGFYPHTTNADSMRELQSDPQKLEELSRQLIVGRIRRWLSIAEQKLEGSDIEVYVSGGNDDPEYVDDLLRESRRILDPEGNVSRLVDGHEMITCAWTNPTPWKTAREYEEQQLQDRLEAIILRVGKLENCIFNIHVPPIDSGLDLCQKLDEDIRPVFSRGQPVMFGAGSTAVRSVIEKHQPLLGLHGHIHESRGAVKIGRTLCLNPGSEYSEGILRGVIVDLDERRVKGHIFTAG